MGRADAEILVLAEELVGALPRLATGLEGETLGRCSGASLEGLQLEHPWLAKQVPVILGEHVTLDAGTGAVHTAPAHGQEDFAIGKSYGLPVDNPVGRTGALRRHAELVAGLKVDAAGPVIIAQAAGARPAAATAALPAQLPALLAPQDAGDLPRHLAVVHQHGQPRAARRHAARHQAGALDARMGRTRITGMIENRPDWCLSRQRTWGVPITLFTHRATGALHPRTGELIAAGGRDAWSARGIDAWFALDPAELLGADAEQLREVHGRHGRVGRLGHVLRVRGGDARGFHAPRWICIWKARISIAAGSTARC